jgi:hypothetical protein
MRVPEDNTLRWLAATDEKKLALLAARKCVASHPGHFDRANPPYLINV